MSKIVLLRISGIISRDIRGIASLEYALLAIGILTGLAAAVGSVAAALDPAFSVTIVGLL